MAKRLNLKEIVATLRQFEVLREYGIPLTMPGGTTR